MFLPKCFAAFSHQFHLPLSDSPVALGAAAQAGTAVAFWGWEIPPDSTGQGKVPEAFLLSPDFRFSGAQWVRWQLAMDTPR